jgi:hypothetical protein
LSAAVEVDLELAPDGVADATVQGARSASFFDFPSAILRW